MKHSSSFYYDLDFGEKAEDWIKEIFSDGLKIEVKCDRMAHKTGNLFVEIYSRGEKSGISVTQANHWIFKIEEKSLSLIVSTEKLKELCRIVHQIDGMVKGGDNNTSFGVLIPIKLLL
jgi:hypothetical protein